MSDDHVIGTHSLSWGFAEADEIELSSTPTTRIIFRPSVHSHGVRGHLVRQKIGADGKWLDTNEANFRVLPPDAAIQIELDSDATLRLFQRLEQLYALQEHGVESGDHHYVVGRQNEVLLIDDANKAEVIKELLRQGHSEAVWTELAREDPDLATRLAAARIQEDREAAIREFEESIETYSGDEAYWQKFFEDHSWILECVFSAEVFMLGGETYLGGKKALGKQGVGGVATDFLFADESTKSFAVVEIKTPSARLVGPIYRGSGAEGDNDVYSMHGSLSGGVVQVRNQIAVAVDQFEAVLGRDTRAKMNRIHPKGVLIVGIKRALSDREVDSFNLFRHSLYSLTIITYDELLGRLRLLFGVDEGL